MQYGPRLQSPHADGRQGLRLQSAAAQMWNWVRPPYPVVRAIQLQVLGVLESRTRPHAAEEAADVKRWLRAAQPASSEAPLQQQLLDFLGTAAVFTSMVSA
mmetsp:Transcript_13240/g.34287  ORF Transcript_13240/g.34287 Transcript_13240/m.34287 type:complete len:101 (+) Transcript_13240:113-415(+)